MNSNVKCEAANFMQTVQDDSKYIVRTKDIAFYLCSTMSSDETKTKFDFTDPTYCTPCEKFDPENDIIVDGDDGNEDTEESITPDKDGDDDEDEKEKDKSKDKSKNKDSKEEPKEGKKPQMTRDMKLKVIKNTFSDWLEYCDVQEDPIENISVNMDSKD